MTGGMAVRVESSDPRRFTGADGAPGAFDFGAVDEVRRAGGPESSGGFGSYHLLYRDGAVVAGMKLFDRIRTKMGDDAAWKSATEEFGILRELDGAGGHAPKAFWMGTYRVPNDDPSVDEDERDEVAIVMEHVSLKTLKRVVEGGRLTGDRATLPSAEKTVEVALRLSEAIAACQWSNIDAQISHRDLNYKNIMIDVDSTAPYHVRRAVLIDFGQSVHTDDGITSLNSETLGPKLGTYEFSAPELFPIIGEEGELERSEHYGKRNAHAVDVWSIGALAYYTRTGMAPYVTEVAALGKSVSKNWDEIKRTVSLDLIAAIERGGGTATPLDRALGSIIARCTAYDPADRPQSVFAVQHLLSEALGGRNRVSTRTPASQSILPESAIGEIRTPDLTDSRVTVAARPGEAPEDGAVPVERPVSEDGMGDAHKAPAVGRNRQKRVRVLAVAAAVVVIAGVAAFIMSTGALHSSDSSGPYWGDSDGGRSSYTEAEVNDGVLGNRVVLNSISDSVIGDEKNFVAARDAESGDNGPGNVWSADEISVEEGKTYAVRLFVGNDSELGYSALAHDTQVAFSLPYGSAREHLVKGWVRSSNAEPDECWDCVKFVGDSDFKIEYIEGSALLENGGVGSEGGTALEDAVADHHWVSIGYDSLDGNVPAGYKYAEYVTIEVAPVFD